MHGDKPYTLDPGMGVLLADLGLSVPDVLRRARMPENLLTRSAVRLDIEEYYRLWQAVEQEAGEPADLPIRIAKAISVEVFNPPIFAAMCSPDLNTAAKRIAHYKRLIGPLKMSVRRGRAETTLEKVWPAHPAPPPSMVGFELLFWVAMVRLATRHPVRPLRMVSRHPPQEQAPYRDYAGCVIEQGETNQIVFSAEDAQRPFLTANDQMWAFFEPELRRRLADLEAGAALSEQVRGVLLELLPAGDASMETVSRRLRLSGRTLQRRLRSEGTSFKKLLNRTREALARHYLTSSVLPVSEISFLLGYENPTSFYRAFHAWTGQTPESLRAAG